MAIRALAVRLALLLLSGLVLVLRGEGVSAGAFLPTNSLVLCAYTGGSLETPCVNQNLAAGASADLTVIVSNPSGSPEASLATTLIPVGAVVPGPETNGLCSDSTDSDADGKANDGCPIAGVLPEQGTQCDNSVDDDGDTLVNDGCPSVGAAPVGAVVGKAYVSSTLSFLNNPCSGSVDDTKFLFNATVDNSVGMEYGTLPQGSAGSEGVLEFFRDDLDGNYLPRHVDRYPAFLNRIFDPDRVGDINGDGDEFDAPPDTPVAENPGASPADWYGTVEPVRPVARYSMSWFVTAEAQLLQLLVFSPGALAAFEPPHPLGEFRDPSLGYAMVSVYGDPTIEPGLSSVTDSCTPSETRAVLWGHTRDNPCTGAFPACPNDDTPCYLGCGYNGCINGFGPDPFGCPTLNDSGTGPCSGTNEAGCVRYANPSTAGTHLFYVYQQSQRDADNDGKENTLDTCPLTYDTLNPRTGAGPDADFDLIADACDTNGNGSTDIDGDGFVNTQDNCPQWANADQKESETVTPHATAAKRGGSRADGMGDPCDPNPTKADGHFHTVLTAVPKCIGATDSDGDGWCNTEESTYGSNGNNAASRPEHYDLFVPLALTHSGSGNNPATPSPESGSQCLGFSDNDGDAFVNDGCPAVGESPESGSQCWGNVDNDGDGYVNDGCPAQVAREPRQRCNDGVDNDLDGLIDALDLAGCVPAGLPIHPGYPACPTNGCAGIDTDGDGFTDEAEILIGTDALGRCDIGNSGDFVPSTDWPIDLASGGTPNSTDTITLGDLTSFLAPVRHLDRSPGDPGYDSRWDLVPGPTVAGSPWIQLDDQTSMLAGATGLPPMFNGEKAFTGPPCSAHPAYGD